MTDRHEVLIPVDDDHDTGGFFAAAAMSQLALRTCNGCESVLHMPRMYCRHCGSWEGRWQVVDGAATLYSWTVVTHQVHPAYPVPYTVFIVDLDARPGVRLAGRLAGDPELHAGMAMEIWFERIVDTDGQVVVVPNWRPTENLRGHP